MAQHVCPWWMGYWLVNPLRKLRQNPEKILSPYVKEGMRVLDIGSGMGYFSLPAAMMTGAKGRVICVDLQEKMLQGLKHRADRAGLSGRIENRTAKQNSLMIPDLSAAVDFALAFAIMHEVEDPARAFGEIFAVLKSGGKFLLAEPRGRVSASAFEETLRNAVQSGFYVTGRPKISSSHAALLEKL